MARHEADQHYRDVLGSAASERRWDWLTKFGTASGAIVKVDGTAGAVAKLYVDKKLDLCYVGTTDYGGKRWYINPKGQPYYAWLTNAIRRYVLENPADDGTLVRPPGLPDVLVSAWILEPSFHI